MKILITGAKGFVGKNLCAALEEICLGHDRRSDHALEDPMVFAYDVDNTAEELDAFWDAKLEELYGDESAD